MKRVAGQRFQRLTMEEFNAMRERRRARYGDFPASLQIPLCHLNLLRIDVRRGRRRVWQAVWWRADVREWLEEEAIDARIFSGLYLTEEGALGWIYLLFRRKEDAAIFRVNWL
jgi:hypothetical protein